MDFSEKSAAYGLDLALDYDPRSVTASNNGGLSANETPVNPPGASTLTVTTLDDIVDDGDGVLSLREAIALAGAGDTITFDASLAGQTITLGLGQLELSKDITIDGDVDDDGTADITVSGNNASRVFDIIGGKATFYGVNVTGGNIENGAGLKIVSNATLVFSNATVSGNNATQSGAGVYNQGTATFVNATLSGNSTLRNGGGVYNEGAATFVNATMSDNSALVGGGVYSQRGAATFVNATISDNSAPTGGGVYNLLGTVTLHNSIILGNYRSPSNASSEVYGIVNGTNNIIGRRTGGPAAADVFAEVDAKGAGVLADNGGPVHTIALKAGGPAIDAGDAAKLVEATLGIDLNGDGDLDDTLVTDAAGQDRVFGNGVDLGALEWREAATPTAPRITRVSSTNDDGVYKIGDEIAITVSFDAAVTVDTSGGVPTLALEAGASDAEAIYAGISEDGTTLTFIYTVREGDTSADLDVTDTGALSLNGATIRSGAGIDTVRELPGPGSDNTLGENKDIVIDGIPPSALSLSLVTDTGIVGDGVTSGGTVAVMGLEAGARWSYSTDGGQNWVDGTDEGIFVLAEGIYAAGSVQARQINAAGNVGVAGALSHTVAVHAEAPFDIFRLVGDSNDAFDYFNTPHGQPGDPVEIYAVRDPDTPIIIEGRLRDDTVDLRAFKGTVIFNGGEGDDLLQFEHGTSGAGTIYNGGTGDDIVSITGKASGSNLKLNDVALIDAGGSGPSLRVSNALLTLDSVENAHFEGGKAADTFDASAFTGRVVLDGGAGADTLIAGSGGSDITGGLGADRIHLGAGADRVIYDANGQSTLAGLDRIHGFDIAADELVFAADNTVQANKTLFQLPFIGSAIRFDNGVVEYRASAWSAWKTDLEDLSFGSLGISSLQKAATAVATFAARNSVLTFEYDEEWYVLEVGNNRNVDNLVHLVGTDFSAATNVHDFVTFA